MDDLTELETTGRVWRRNLLSADEVAALAAHCDVGDDPGARLSLSAELMPLLGPCSKVSREVEKLGPDGVLVRLVAFNKSFDANWGVPWHQDRVIAVKKNVECPEYSKWVEKDGFWHCEPPTELLVHMLFVRIHIDQCDETNGAMEMAVGSHKLGCVSASSAASVATSLPVEVCRAAPGDVLIIKALTLHRSRKAAYGGSRRALRIDYARRSDLDPRLEWSIVC
jgi:ectoine hydroxylase-related dioxygenase (phytanoyl-CoA dioxygenase family)